MADSSASGPQSLTVFMHSNLPQIQDNFTLAGASLVSGWAEASNEAELRRLGARWHNATRLRGAEARLGLAQILKYEWLASAAA